MTGEHPTIRKVTYVHKSILLGGTGEGRSGNTEQFRIYLLVAPISIAQREGALDVPASPRVPAAQRVLAAPRVPAAVLPLSCDP